VPGKHAHVSGTDRHHSCFLQWGKASLRRDEGYFTIRQNVDEWGSIIDLGQD
jgi:hypothetical protein